MHRRGTWRCDFVANDAASQVLGGFVQLVVPPESGDAWYWAYLVGPEIGIVAIRDHEVPRPRRVGDLTVRAEGLWAELVCETPDVHWTIGLEAFGIRLDEAPDARRPDERRSDARQDEFGERVAVGLDIEWDEGTVFGDVLIGTDRIVFDGTGSFLADGVSTWATTPGVDATFDAAGLPIAISRLTGHDRVEVAILAMVPIPLDDGAERLVRVLARWTDARGDAVTGWLDIKNSLASPGGGGRR